MTCAELKALLSPYMDGRVDGKSMRQIREHLDACATCEHEFAVMRQLQRSLAGLTPKKAPPELTLRLKSALSREAARAGHRFWEGFTVRMRNTAGAFMIPATAGVLSAIIFFGLLIGSLAAPPRFGTQKDVPTVFFTPPMLQSSPFGMAIGGVDADMIVVEASIDSAGRVQDYRLLSAPRDKEAVQTQLNNLLIFTTFRPATAFGQPTSGKAVLSFSIVNVKG